MKMEVLSVQNQFQGQFGVIGSSKVKDWISPLTPPPPPPPPTTATTTTVLANKTATAATAASAQPHPALNDTAAADDLNVVAAAEQQPQSQQQQAAMDAAAATITTSSPFLENAVGGVGDNINSSSRFAAYNNNLFCYGGSSNIVNAAAADEIDTAEVNELSQRLQAELRAAKSQHLACTEVSLPWDLMPRIAVEIIKTSEREPCGVRGCTIFIEFEDEPNNTRRIASFKMDPHTVSTFELYLTLKHDKSGWTSLLPQFLKNLTRSSTILISPDFTLTKNKLYFCE